MYVHKSYLMFEQFAIEIIIFYFRKFFKNPKTNRKS